MFSLPSSSLIKFPDGMFLNRPLALLIYEFASFCRLDFRTDADLRMERKSAYRGGLVPNVTYTVSLTMMTTMGIMIARMTEARHVSRDGSAKTA